MSSKKITVRPGRRPAPLFVDTKYVSEALGVSPTVLRSWRQKKYGPKFAQPTPRTILYYRIDVVAWKKKLAEEKSH